LAGLSTVLAVRGWLCTAKKAQLNAAQAIHSLIDEECEKLNNPVR
jgi:hypothetical protein